MATATRRVNIFPPRKRGQSDGELRKDLTARGAPKGCGIITKTELQILRAMADGTFSFTNTGTLPAVGSRGAGRNNALAESHKQRMLAYDEEYRAEDNADDRIEALERELLRQRDLEVANRKLDEKLDEVKLMNNVMNEARCVAVRNAQMEERKRRAEEDKEYESKMHAVMAQEAERAQRVYELRDQERQAQLQRNTEVIQEQMRQRDIDRVRKLEQKQLEEEAMFRHMQRLREEDAGMKLRKQAEARRLMEDVAIANAEMIRLKDEQAAMEQENDRQIAAYIKEKEEREQAYAEEQQRIKAAKEKEIAQIRAKQEMAQDRREQLDDLRARRAQNAYEREQRMKEKARQEHDKAVDDDIRRSRTQQMEEKRKMALQEQDQEREQLERIVAAEAVAVEKEKEKRLRSKQLSNETSLAVRKQIMEQEEKRRRERQEFLEEGRQHREKQRENAAAVAEIRERKLQELDALGVPDRYRKALLKQRKADLRPAM